MFPGQIPFLLLLISQAIHSFEEWYFDLWLVFAPAMTLASLFGTDPSFTFGMLNIAFVGLMWFSYVSFSRERRLIPVIASLWIVIELINGGNHIYHAIVVGGYFPGVFTAPLLIVFSVYTAFRLYQPTQSIES